MDLTLERGNAVTTPTALPSVPPEESLALLSRLRTLAIAGQAVAIGAAMVLDVVLPAAAMVVIVVALAGFNGAALWRLRRRRVATIGEVGLALGLDLAAFTALIVLSGGVANPFHLLFVLHAVLVALLLPPGLALAGTALVLAGYALAHQFGQPLLVSGGHPLPASLGWLGDVLAFLITIVVTAGFIARLAGVLRAQQRLLHDAAERAHRDEMVVRIGALAAGAAHELATPLTTMGLLATQMQHENDAQVLRQDAATLQAQVESLRGTLANLGAAARHAHAGSRSMLRVDRLLDRIGERQRRLRPGIGLSCRWEGALPVPEVIDDPAFEQAVLILLNNAADAAPQAVDLVARWSEARLDVEVCDRGAGVPEAMRERLGRMFFTTKPPGRGTGLGLVLTANVVRERGGTLRFSAREGGGTCVEISLPLAKLQIGSG